jgi:hypothetical protein
MNINLTPEQEKTVEAELNSGHFRALEEVIDEALQLLLSLRFACCNISENAH